MSGQLTLNGLAASQTHLPPNELLYVMVDPSSRVMSEPCPPVVAVADGADVVAVAVPVPLAVLLEPVLPVPVPLPIPVPDLFRVRLRICQHLLRCVVKHSPHTETNAKTRRDDQRRHAETDPETLPALLGRVGVAGWVLILLAESGRGGDVALLLVLIAGGDAVVGGVVPPDARVGEVGLSSGHARSSTALAASARAPWNENVSWPSRNGRLRSLYHSPLCPLFRLLPPLVRYHCPSSPCSPTPTGCPR